MIAILVFFSWLQLDGMAVFFSQCECEFDTLNITFSSFDLQLTRNIFFDFYLQLSIRMLSKLNGDHSLLKVS